MSELLALFVIITHVAAAGLGLIVGQWYGYRVALREMRTVAMSDHLELIRRVREINTPRHGLRPQDKKED